MKYVFYALLALNLLALLLYGIDKARAKAGRWRIPEATLLALGFLGGALGALLGMRLWRHKTRHWYFWAVNVAGLLWQLGLLIFLIAKFGF